ncbi:MAG: hypothetical protein KBA03_05760 [Anaerolineaceae bacterium]|nr:hypothetical protein [Anaerolineaceae bacterium]
MSFLQKVESELLTEKGAWYALRTKPNFEFIVSAQLVEHKIETFFPKIKVKPVNSRSRTSKAYFPGYIFVRGRLDELYAQRVGLMRGVVGLVCFDDLPASISDEIIEIIKQRVLLENSKLQSISNGIQPGEKVWLDDPALRGIDAEFEQCINGEERVNVLLTLLAGRTVRIQVSADKVKRRLD